MNARNQTQKNEPSSTYVEDGEEVDDFKPLTAKEAQAWRAKHPSLSVWRVVGAQFAVGVLLVLLVLAIGQSRLLTLSAGYGVLVVVVPAAVFARGVTRIRPGAQQASMGAFAVWEMAKLILAVILMVAAPKVIIGLNWWMMIAAMIVCMNVSWVALLKRPKSV